ncbi:MAG: response regulator transcription factor [Anaerolineales bacterium]
MINNAHPHKKDDITSNSIVEVLICDDETFIREALKSLLSTYALLNSVAPISKIMVVGEATNGWEALQVIAKHQPDVVLMDAHMPVMDGFEATRAIKASWPQVKVIMLTMYFAQQEAATEAGVDAFLLKGCPVEKLIDTILTTCRPDNEHA